MWLFFIYWPRCTICVQDLSPPTNQGLNSGPQAVNAQSPKHRPTREVLPFGALRQSRQEAQRSSQPPEIKHHCPLHPAPAQARIMPGLAPHPGLGMHRAPQGRSTRGPPETIPHRMLPPAPSQSRCKNHTLTISHRFKMRNSPVCVSVFHLRNK